MTYRDRVRVLPESNTSWLDRTPHAAVFTGARSTFLRTSPLAAPIVVLEAVLGIAVFTFFGLMFDSVIAGGF